MKIGQLYNLDSFQAFLDSGKKPGFTDAYAGTVLARNLTHVDPRVFEKKYPELTFVNSGIIADNTGGYALRIQSLRLRELGDFANAGDVSGNKGKISLSAEDSLLNVLKRAGHSEWSEDEIKEAELGNRNLVSEFIATHNKLYLRNVDLIGYTGIPDVSSSEGLLNYSGFTSDAAGGVASALTSQQLYDAIAGLIVDQWNAVNNTIGYMATNVTMPVSAWNEANKKILNSAASADTVMQALVKNFPSVRFNASFRAEDVGGASATVAHGTGADAMVMRIPQPLTIGEIIKQSSFDFRVDSKYRIAGLDVLEDTAGRLLTGL